MSSLPTEQTAPFARGTSYGSASASPPMIWKADSNQGQRKDNQDRAIAVSPADQAHIAQKGVLLLVCDGVGGEQGGDIAAAVASAAALKAYYNEPANDPRQALELAISKGQQAVRQEAMARPQYARMASTIVAAAVYSDTLYVCHVGDSRAYLFRDGQLKPLTRDHTFANAQVDSGAMSADEAQRSTYRSTLVRSLGMHGNHQPDSLVELLQPGDRVLLCSDGLHGSVDDAHMAQILSEQPDPARAVSNLIAAAIANQSGDNISAALLNYGIPAAAGAAGNGARHRSAVPLIAVGAALLVAIAAGLWWANGRNSGSGGVGGTATPAAQNAAVATVGNPAVGVTGAPVGAPVATSTSFQAAVTPTDTASAAVETTPSVEAGSSVSATVTLAALPTATNTPKPTLRPTRTNTPVPTPVPSDTPIPPTDVPKPKPPQPPPPKTDPGG